jgi:hypothetical protein
MPVDLRTALGLVPMSEKFDLQSAFLSQAGPPTVTQRHPQGSLGCFTEFSGIH